MINLFFRLHIAFMRPFFSFRRTWPYSSYLLLSALGLSLSSLSWSCCSVSRLCSFFWPWQFSEIKAACMRPLLELQLLSCQSLKCYWMSNWASCLQQRWVLDRDRPCRGLVRWQLSCGPTLSPFLIASVALDSFWGCREFEELNLRKLSRFRVNYWRAEWICSLTLAHCQSGSLSICYLLCWLETSTSESCR